MTRIDLDTIVSESTSVNHIHHVHLCLVGGAPECRATLITEATTLRMNVICCPIPMKWKEVIITATINVHYGGLSYHDRGIFVQYTTPSRYSNFITWRSIRHLESQDWASIIYLPGQAESDEIVAPGHAASTPNCHKFKRELVVDHTPSVQIDAVTMTFTTLLR